MKHLKFFFPIITELAELLACFFVQVMILLKTSALGILYIPGEIPGPESTEERVAVWNFKSPMRL